MKFVKMHGLGNDYVYVDGFRQEAPADPAALAKVISDRHTGIGGDGLIEILPCEGADARMRIFNIDGSEGGMCGNGIRCVGKYLYDSGICKKEIMQIMTKSGMRTLRMIIENGKAAGARVEMGQPVFLNEDLRVSIGDMTFDCVNLSLGNPHAVIIGEMPSNEVYYKYGPLLEKNAVFPEGANIEWIEIIDEHCVRMRVWERGSGETLACGTGACASAAAAIRKGHCVSPVRVQLPLGELLIEWNDDAVYMTGPAATSFRGEWTEE